MVKTINLTDTERFTMNEIETGGYKTCDLHEEGYNHVEQDEPTKCHASRGVI